MRRWLGADAAKSAHDPAVRFVEHFPELANNPTFMEVQGRMLSLSSGEGFRADDAAVLYVTGHGELYEDKLLCVLLRNTKEPELSTTALFPAELIKWLRATSIGHLLILIDVCFAGQAARDSWLLDLRPRPGWIALGATASHQRAQVQALTRAIAHHLSTLAAPGVARDIDHGDPYLNVGRFITAIQRQLRTAGQELVLLFPRLPSMDESSPCLRNPYYLGRRTISDLDAHWDPRARGVARAKDSGWLFTGRERLMARLVTCTTEPPTTVVVTGAAGTGKSAVLARLVTLSDKHYVARHRTEVDKIRPAQRPEPDAIDAAVRASGKLPLAVLTELCDQLNVPVRERADFDQVLADWRAWLARRRREVTIVVDALDEALDPYNMLTGLLERLDGSPERRLVRLIIGVRSPRRGDETSRAVTNLDVLADRATALPGTIRLAVDEPSWWDEEDLVEYARRLLSIPDSAYAARPELAAPVARRVAERSGGSYLVAQLAAVSLAGRDEPVDPDDPAWQDVVGSGVPGIFAEELRRHLPSPDERGQAVDLLRAVAFAYGPGIPWRGVWPAVANAVADKPEATGYGDHHVAWLLGTPFGAYLTMEGADGATVYRLFHDSLRQVLRTEPESLLEAER
jgi:hypothetical protein